MKPFLVLILSFLSIGTVMAQEIDADQLEGLSDCDYFKYTECTGAGLNIGACVKTKYQGFVKACGKVHADKFLYSREMYKPEKKKLKAGCESVKKEVCEKKGMDLPSCVKKNKDTLVKACGEGVLEEADMEANSDLKECYALRQKYCGNEMTLECDEIFQAKAPAHCKERPLDTQKRPKGVASDQKMLASCMDTITKSCEIDDDALMKKGADVSEAMKKYQVCVKRAVMKAGGKCGSMFPDKEKILKEKTKK